MNIQAILLLTTVVFLHQKLFDVKHSVHRLCILGPRVEQMYYSDVLGSIRTVTGSSFAGHQKKPVGVHIVRAIGCVCVICWDS